MKTHQEILVEAQRLESLGRQYWAEHRQARRRGGPVAEVTRVLFNFPLTQSRVYDLIGGSEETRVRHTWRWIEVGLTGEQPEYRLMQEWAAGPASGGTDDHPEAFVELSDSDAEEALREGYAQVEAERLAECLAPVVARLEEVGFCDGMHTALEEVETIIGARDLSPAACLRARADAVEFLEGRMRPSDFITEAVERQYEREAVSATVVERPGERLVIDER